ncbi:MAG: PAS domain S-box protein [Elusimicrobiota bacterium]|nr:PAS domain S-box protein [Elusimicrobiota bacterium]
MDFSGKPFRESMGTLMAAALALLLGVVVGLVQFRHLHGRILEVRYQTLGEVLEVKSAQLRSWLSERSADADYFAQDPEHLHLYQRLAARDDAARARLVKAFTALHARGRFNSVRVLARDGRPLLEVPGGPARPHFFEVARAVQAAGGLRLELRYALDDDVLRMVSFMPSVERTAETLLLRVADGSVRRLDGSAYDTAAHGAAGLAARIARGERTRLAALDQRGVLCDAEARHIPGTDWVIVLKSARAESTAAALRGALHAAAAAAGCLLIVMLLLLRDARRRGDEAARQANGEKTLLAQALEQAAESVVITDARGLIRYVNPAFTRVTGYSREEALGQSTRLLKSGKHDARFYEEMWSVIARGLTWHGRIVNRRKDGSLFEEEASIAPVRGPDGAVTHYVAVKRDASVENALEQQLRHAQKMDAVGRLAGGVAHDFNNILTSIIGNAELVLMQAPPGSPLTEDIRQIVKAGKTAAGLTRQLLVFSRKQLIEPVVLDANAALRDLEKLLRRTIGEDVKLALQLKERPLWMKIDPTQFDQVLINLAVNARDAMPQGGRLVITSDAAEFLAATTFPYGRVPAGQYAKIRVADEGTGMTPAVMDRIFEPFFTTKEKGRGTGLGLATVFGIVKQAGGYILVDSAPGKGSAFTLFFPLVGAPEEAREVVESRTGAKRAGETILLVEDQEEVRGVAERALRAAGYVVLPCANGPEALAVEAAHRGDVHLLLSDVVMPGMGGRELSQRLRERRPGLRVLFMSGYTDNEVERGGVLKPGVDLIQKPFSITALLERVRAALDRRGVSGQI